MKDYTYLVTFEDGTKEYSYSELGIGYIPSDGEKKGKKVKQRNCLDS
jgi:hypothetical protein